MGTYSPRLGYAVDEWRGYELRRSKSFPVGRLLLTPKLRLDVAHEEPADRTD